MIFTIDHLRSISFFCQNAHHVWLTIGYKSNWFLVKLREYFLAFWQETEFWKPFWQIVDAILEDVSVAETIKLFNVNTRLKITIFHCSKNYGSPTGVTTRLKVSPNMAHLSSSKDWDSHLEEGGLLKTAGCNSPRNNRLESLTFISLPNRKADLHSG